MQFPELLETGVLPEDWTSFYAQASLQGPGYLEAFYGQSLQPSRAIREQRFVAVDIETSGLDAERDSIVSIGAVPFTLDRVELASAKYWLVKPDRLSADSIKIHGITHQQIAGAPSLSEVLPELVEMLSNTQVVVHYRYMEREFFRHSVLQAAGVLWLFPVVDTLEIEAQYLQRQQTRVQRLLKKRLPSLHLAQVRRRYGLPDYENHNALTDALATAELLIAQIAYQNLENQPLKILWR